MNTRREFLAQCVGAGLGVAAAGNGALAGVLAAAGDRPPEEVARDEAFWREVQAGFTVDRNLMNLNNGGVSPSPRVVQEAMRRYLEQSNAAPAHTMWELLEPEIETVRARLARAFGCDPEELAVTRNASEALETLIFGLELRPGDEVIATTQNYPRMITSWKQRALREGIVYRTFPVPVRPEDPAEIVEAYRKAITPRTRVMEVMHVGYLNGYVYPVRELTELGRERGVQVIVDGAHAFAHFPFAREELGCDFYGTSLHKWLMAPHGTGFLYVRKDRIPEVWPLMAAPEPRGGNVRKFEEIGTHPAANHNAIGEALAFHEGIGATNKIARLRYLSERWLSKVADEPRVKVLTDPRRAGALRLVALEGLDPPKLREHLLKKHGIIVVAIKHDEFEGIRVTPSVYTTLGELDRFVDALQGALKRGV